MSGRRRDALILAGLLLLALLARLPGLYSRSVWFDEAFTLLQTAGTIEAVEWPREPTRAEDLKAVFAGRPGTGDLARLVRRSDVHPPVYPVALGWWRTLGPSVEVARWFSLLFSLVSVAAFYALLRVAGEAGAAVYTALYALATGAAHAGHEARAYAFATAWRGIAALLAFLAHRLAAERGPRAALAGGGAGICCGLAFFSNYFTAFPIAVILGWALLGTWSRSRVAALAGPAVAAVGFLLGLPLLLDQYARRFFEEFLTLVQLHAEFVGIPMPFDAPWRGALGGAMFLAALVGSFVVLSRGAWREPLWRLLLPLAFSQAVGILVLDAVFDHRLLFSRYLTFVGPALVAVTGLGLVRLLRARPRLGVLLLAVLMTVQLTRINWGFSNCVRGQIGSLSRDVAAIIDGYSELRQIAVVSEGGGVGTPALWAYELSPGTEVVFLGRGTDVDALVAALAPYQGLWFVNSAEDGIISEVERRFVDRLWRTGRYVRIFQNPLAIGFVQRVQEGPRGPPPGERSLGED